MRDPAYKQPPIWQGIQEAVQDTLSNDPKFLADIEDMLSGKRTITSGKRKK